MEAFLKSKVVWAGIVVAILLAFMFALFGYSSGYGVKVDGAVQFVRKPLIHHIHLDYKRDQGEWSFGYFVPIAVLGLFMFRRKELLKEPVSPALIGGVFFLSLGLLIYWAGYRGEQKYFGYAAGQILALGIILWFLGWKWFGQLFWLWFLLGMMWPWRFLIGRISSPLQMVMVQLTSKFMGLIGVDASTSGSKLLTASLDPVTGVPISLDVDVACSGMRSLFALVMIGLVFVFLRLNVEWKRWLVMAFVPIIAVIGNFVRMLMLYFGSLLWGTKFAIGEGHEMSRYHLFAGLMVFVVALIIMSGLVQLLEGGSVRKLFEKKRVVTRTVSECEN